jgi:hypothetical protein
MIAYCGLDCGSCPIHVATYETDALKKKQMRDTIARICNERYGMSLKSEGVGDCDGCRSTSGKLFSACQTCEIRQCARKKNFETCASCVDYGCGLLQKLFDDDPGARARLEALRRTM